MRPHCYLYVYCLPIWKEYRYIPENHFALLSNARSITSLSRLLMTRETRVMASFTAELSQQIALVLPPLQDNNSKLHMYNCNVSPLAN